MPWTMRNDHEEEEKVCTNGEPQMVPCNPKSVSVPAQIAAADDDNDNVAGTGLTFLVILAGYNDAEVKKMIEKIF